MVFDPEALHRLAEAPGDPLAENQWLRDAVTALVAERDGLLQRFTASGERWAHEAYELTQVLGQALGYPHCADVPNMIVEAGEYEQVYVGEHTHVTLADEAAKRLREQAFDLTEARRLLEVWSGRVSFSAASERLPERTDEWLNHTAEGGATNG